MQIRTSSIGARHTASLYIGPFLLFSTFLLAGFASAQEAPLKPELSFKPVLENVLLEAASARPGDSVGVVYYFRNSGTGRAEKDYRVFVHFEPTPSCEKIPFQQDHEPTVSAQTWEPGRLIVDGPYEIAIPAGTEEGEYFIHVGLYTPGGGRHGDRVYETYWS